MPILVNGCSRQEIRNVPWFLATDVNNMVRVADQMPTEWKLKP